MKKFQAFKLTRKEMRNVLGGTGIYPADKKLSKKWCSDTWGSDADGYEACEERCKTVNGGTCPDEKAPSLVGG